MTRPGAARAGAARDAPRGARSRAPRRGSACRCPGRRAPARARSRGASWRGHAGNAGEAAVERAVQDVEPAAAQRLEGEPVGNPRREPEHAFDPWVVCDRDRHRAAHREAEQERALGVDALDRRLRVFDARVEAVPRLDPVLDLREAKLREPRREARRRATRATRSTSLRRRLPGRRSRKRPPLLAGPCMRISAPLVRRSVSGRRVRPES